jgi:carbon monoxide dehydrogenase subunit G
MTTKVEKTILVNVPVSTAYNQWTQFEDFPQFMGGIKSVTQLSDDRLQWVAEIAGVKRQWEGKILEQVPDQKVAWAATEGATNAGSVTFEPAGDGQTNVHLSLEYEPEGLVEKVGDKLNIVENQAEKDLERFKAFVESEGYATGAWRGTVNEGATVGTPGVEDAAVTQGDSGKAGVSGKAVAAGAGLAAAAAAGVAAATSAKKSSDEGSVSETSDVGYVPEAGTSAAAGAQDFPPAEDTTGFAQAEVVTPVQTPPYSQGLGEPDMYEEVPSSGTGQGVGARFDDTVTGSRDNLETGAGGDTLPSAERDYADTRLGGETGGGTEADDLGTGTGGYNLPGSAKDEPAAGLDDSITGTDKDDLDTDGGRRL